MSLQNNKFLVSACVFPLVISLGTNINFAMKEKDKCIIGSACVMNYIAHNQVINDNFPVLAQAALSVAAEQIRNVATIGGNVGN